MDETTSASEAYDEDITDIQNDDDPDDAADLLDSVIEHELAKFHQQQAVKYAEISAAGQWAPLSLPSPAPVQQQIRAEERQQLELLQSDREHQQHAPESYVPSPGALAVTQLWQQQVEQQSEHQQHQEQQLRPFSSQRPWSAAADVDDDAASDSHATYAIDAVATAAQQQELAGDWSADGDAAEEVHSRQLSGCGSGVTQRTPAGAAPALYTGVEEQAAAGIECHAGQEQSEQLCSFSSTGCEAEGMEETTPGTETAAGLDLDDADAGTQQCCLPEEQQGLSAAEAGNVNSTGSTPGSAHSAGAGTEAAVRIADVTESGEHARCQQLVQQLEELAVLGVNDDHRTDHNASNIPLFLKEATPDIAAAGGTSGMECPGSNQHMELHWSSEESQEQQQYEQQGYEQQHQDDQLQQDEDEATGVAHVYSEGEQCAQHRLLQHPLSQQYSEEAMTSRQQQQQAVQSKPELHQQLPGHEQQQQQQQEHQRELDKVEWLQQQHPQQAASGRQSLQHKGIAEAAAADLQQQAEAQLMVEIKQQIAQKGCAGVVLAEVRGSQGQLPEDANRSTWNSTDGTILPVEAHAAAAMDGSMPVVAATATAPAAAPGIGGSNVDTAWMVWPTAGPADVRIQEIEAQHFYDRLPGVGGLGALQMQSALTGADAVHASQPQYIPECTVVAETMPAVAANRSEHVDNRSVVKDSTIIECCGVSAAAATQPPVLQGMEHTQRQSGQGAAVYNSHDCAADDLGIYQDPDECDDSSSCSTPAGAAEAAVAAAVSGTGAPPVGCNTAAGAGSPPCAYAANPGRGSPATAAASDAAGGDYGYGVQHAAVNLRSLSLNDRASSTGGSGGAAAACLGGVQPPDCSGTVAQWTGSDISISAWPAEYCTPPAAAYDGYRSSSSCSAYPPDEQQQQQRRPVHSRIRPSGSQSPFLQAARGTRMGCQSGGCGSGGSVLGARVRPGSAPCQQSLSPTKPSYIGNGASSRCQQQGWIPGVAMAAQQQLQHVYGTYHTARSASSSGGGKSAAATAAAGSMLVRPHTSGGAASSGPMSVNPMHHRPPWQVPVAREVVLVSTAAAAAASRERPEYSHQQQHQQQQSMRPRPCSAPRARMYEPLLQQSTASARRPCSSRMYSSSSATMCRQLNWQQQSQQYNVLPMFEDGEAADEEQQCASGEWVSTVQAHDKRGQQQQPQQRQRPLPAWDASPIPLNTPKTMPIADATQPAELLVATKVNRVTCAVQSDTAQQHMHMHVAGSGAAVVRPRTAGAAGAAAIMREHPDSIRVGVHDGSSSSNNSSSSSVYLVEIHQKLKQANSCCIKLGVGRHYCIAPSTKARWNVEQITVEVWQFASIVTEVADPQQGQEQQQQQQQGGWQLRSHLTLYQFNRQLDKLIAKVATHATAAADSAAAGYKPNSSSAVDAHAAYRSVSNCTSLSSSPAGSRGVSPDRSRPASAVAQPARLGILPLPLGGAETETGVRQGSRLSPRRQAAIYMLLQQQQEEKQCIAQQIAAATVMVGGPGRVQAGSGAAMLPYGVPAWLQEHL